MNILTVLPFDSQQKKRLEAENKKGKIVYTAPDRVTDEELSEAEIIIGNIPADKLKLCKSLKWLQLNSAGTEGYPENMPPNTVLTNATGAYGLAISEHMLGMLLEIKKKLYLYRDNQQKHIWQSEGSVTSIEDSVALIVGMGDIGGEFARKIKALGAYVIGVKRTSSDKPDYCDELYTAEHLKELVPRADIIALSLPGNKQTEHIFDSATLKLTKKGSVLLNVGRGSAIDTTALCRLLKNGHFEGVGLDVTEPEPLPENHPLWDIPNAIITPHISGFFHLHKTLERIIDISIDNLSRFNNGSKLRNIVDYTTGYRKKD